MKSWDLHLVLGLAFLLGGTALALADPGYSGGDGSSYAKAILITGATSDREETHAEYVYLTHHFPHYILSRQSLLQQDGKYYDLLEFDTADHAKRAVYFNITDSFERFLKQRR